MLLCSKGYYYINAASERFWLIMQFVKKNINNDYEFNNMGINNRSAQLCERFRFFFAFQRSDKRIPLKVVERMLSVLILIP